MNDKIEIPLSKRKVFLLFIASTAFGVFGIFGAINPENFVSPIFRNTAIISFFCILAICFFGISSLSIVRKLFDKKLGLIIEKKGIIDNTNAVSVGLIEWEDIIRIERRQIMSTKFLILHMENPKKYIERTNNFFSKRAAEMNYKTYGSPITITSGSLQINFEDLEAFINNEFNKSKDI